MSSGRRGPPKHQNKYAWKANAGRKINETEVGGKFRPFSEITGVCPRCREQIDWKRRYGKYKPLVEPAKCQRCSKRAVRQAYHNLCSGCAKEHGICAKCCCAVDRIVGRDPSEVEAEQKQLEEAIKNSRERDRRTLLRTMNKGKSKGSGKTPTDNKVGQLFPNASLEGYAKSNRHNGDHDDGEIRDNKYADSDDEDDNGEYEDCDDKKDDDIEIEHCDDDNSEHEDCEEEEDDDDEGKFQSK